MALSMKNSPELTQEEVYTSLIQPLTAASVVLAAGPKIIDSPTGDPLRIPRYVDGANAGWYAENELIGESDPDFNELTLLPTNLKSVKVLHRFSNELARHSVVPIASQLQSALVRNVASVLDQAFLSGAGTVDGNGNKIVTGLTNQSGIQTGTLDVTSAANLLTTSVEAVGLFADEEISDLSNAVYFVNPADYRKVLTVKDADGRSILVPDLQRAGVYSLNGVRVVPTTKLAAGTALLVDMNQVVIGRDLNPSVKFLDQTYAEYDQLAIRVAARMDIGLLHPEGVIKLTVDSTP
jgi:HK97 family phage major capsid protein